MEYVMLTTIAVALALGLVFLASPRPIVATPMFVSESRVKAVVPVGATVKFESRAGVWLSARVVNHDGERYTLRRRGHPRGAVFYRSIE